jgi:hypothetical protein
MIISVTNRAIIIIPNGVATDTIVSSPIIIIIKQVFKCKYCQHHFCFLLFNTIDWEIVLLFIIPSVYILMMIFFILATFWFSRYRRKKLHEAEPLSRKGKLIGIFSWICLWLFGAGSYAIAAIIGLIAIGVDKRKDRRRDRSF